jgi:hypothetical protein
MRTRSPGASACGRADGGGALRPVAGGDAHRDVGAAALEVVEPGAAGRALAARGGHEERDARGERQRGRQENEAPRDGRRARLGVRAGRARRALDARGEAIERDLLLEAPLLLVEAFHARAAVGAPTRVGRRRVAERLARAQPAQGELSHVFLDGLRGHSLISFNLRSAMADTLSRRLRTVGTERPIAAATSSSVISSTK